MAHEHGMIEPFQETQVREGVISYGLSSYGYDLRVSDEFKKISPLGKIPVFEADDGFTLPDSSCIIPYLERVHPEPSLYPKAAQDFGWALFLESLTPAIGASGAVAAVMIVYAMKWPNDEWLILGIFPIRVPIEVVECFFLGQGPADIPAADSELQATNVIVRLAEVATQWHRVRVTRSLGHWCDGYITVRGMWCEPLDVKLVNRMNKRLAEAKKQRGGPSGATS